LGGSHWVDRDLSQSPGLGGACRAALPRSSACGRNRCLLGHSVPVAEHPQQLPRLRRLKEVFMAAETVRELLEKMGVDVEALERQVKEAEAGLKRIADEWAAPVKEMEAALRELQEKWAPDLRELKAKLDETSKERIADAFVKLGVDVEAVRRQFEQADAKLREVGAKARENLDLNRFEREMTEIGDAVKRAMEKLRGR
jgi:uncharacterized protein (DUF342 family)